MKLSLKIISILLLFVQFSIAQVPSKKMVVDKIIAKIDNQMVLKSELEMAYLQFASQKSANANLKMCDVLENLIINKFLVAKADIDSVVIEDKVIEDQLDRRMQYFIQQIGSEKKLEEYYNKTILELRSELKEQVKEQMLVQKMQINITKGAKVTPGEVKRFFEKMNPDSLPYYSKEIEVGQIVKTASINKNEKKVAFDKLNSIRSEILEGKSFYNMADLYSEDVVSAKQGGDLGFWKRGELVPEYEAAALKLKPEEISPVIESPFGYHIIKLTEKRGLEYKSSHILIKIGKSGSDLDNAKLELLEIKKNIENDSITFAKAAKKHSDDKLTQNSGGIINDENSGSSKIPLQSLDPSIFFIIDTMKVGQISAPQPYRLQDGKEALRIIYFKSKFEPHKANLKDDYQKIFASALNEKKSKMLSEWFKKHQADIFIQLDEEYKNCQIFKD